MRSNAYCGNLLWQSILTLQAQLLQWDPRSPAYLRTTLGIASREYFTKAYLRPLTEAGLVVRTDPDHPNSPRQKYALTKAGSERIRRVAPL